MIFLRQEMLSWQIGIAVLFGGYLILGQWLFVRHHLLLPAVSVGVSLGLLVALYDIAKFRAERKTREQMKSIFAKYVTREVMDQLLERPELAQLGGRKEIVTILFSDIRGFTSLSETLEPQDVVGQLNEYLSTMTAIIFAEHGIIDKFVGDGIMVYFGAPVYPQEHAWRAIKVAIQMQNGMETLRAKWQSEGKPDIQIGIGVNTGSVIMGNIGSSQYMDFTLIGDAVNLSSRLCTVAAAGEILISDSTYREVGDRVVVAK